MAGMKSMFRDRFDLKPGQHKPKVIRNGTITVVLASLFVFTIYTKPSVPFLSGGGKELKAEFVAGTNVRPGYTPVRVHGVQVGQVTDIKRGANDRGAIITMTLDKGTKLDIRDDVRMALRWRTLLGRNIYVDIDPGSPSRPKWAGGTLPKSRTQDQVELDTALEPLDVNGRAALQTAIKEFDKGFGSPAAVREAIGTGGGALAAAGGNGNNGKFAPSGATGGAGSMRAGADGLPALRGVTVGDLPKLVQNANRALGELTRDQVALGGLVTDGSIALGVTAARRADLASTLNIAPGTLRTTRTTLQRLETTLDVVDPLADQLKPGLAKLPKTANDTARTLRVLRPLLRDLRPTLNDLRPAVTDLGTASRAGVPSFEPLNHSMQLIQDKYIPFLNATDPSTLRKNYTNIGPLGSHVASAISWSDKNGAFANFEAAIGEGSTTGLPCAFNPSDPEKDITKALTCNLASIAMISGFTGDSPAKTLRNIKPAGNMSGLSLLKQYVEGDKKLDIKGIPSLSSLLKKKGR